jgi:hypothetical protein
MISWLAGLWPVRHWLLQKREIDENLNGIEWLTAHVLSTLRLLSVSFLIKNVFLTRDAEGKKTHDVFTEFYVLGVFALLIAILVCSNFTDRWPIVVAIYFLAESIDSLAVGVMLKKLPSSQSPISIERSLILLLVNAAEITVGFSVIYRVLLPVEPDLALFYAVSVFATIGAPPGGHGIVVAQVACNFVFLAVFVATYVSSLGSLKTIDKVTKRPND